MNENLRLYAGGLDEQLSRLGQHWPWFLTGGLGYIVLGLVALSWPVSSTVGLAVALGALFVAGGIMHTIQSIKLRNETGSSSRVLLSIAALAAGILMLRYPAAGVFGIAIAMTSYFFISATAKGAVALGMRPHRGWGWAFASATASFLLGVYIIATFPVSALWVPGLVLGVDFIIHGSSLIGISFDLKNAHKEIRETPAGRTAA